jgi:hypothetical protein
MANEVSISATLSYAKNKATAKLATSFLASQTGDKYMAGVQIIGTTEESFTKADIGTIGYVAARNMDPTNFVQLGAATGAYSIKLLPGQGCVVPWGAANTFVKADTAVCEVEYLLIEA